MPNLSVVLREKSAQVVQLARTMSDADARAGLVDYAQWLLSKAQELEERDAAMPTTVVLVKAGRTSENTTRLGLAAISGGEDKKSAPKL